MAVMDAKGEVESWITVNGNHIPIMKGQSKEDAVKSFIASKSDKASAKRESKPTSVGKATSKVVEQTKKNQETYKEHKRQESAKKHAGELNKRSEKPEHISESVKKVNAHAEKVAGKPSTAERLKHFEELGLVRNEDVPQGWKETEGATTAPNGYKWYNNGESMFGGKYEHGLFPIKEEKYSPEFEVVRKNALANPLVYNHKYTQKSKAEAYKEYLSDTEKKEKSESKENWWEPKTKEEGRFWLADTLASTEGFTGENFSKQDKEILKRLDKKFGKGWWKTEESPKVEKPKVDSEKARNALRNEIKNTFFAEKARLYGYEGPDFTESENDGVLTLGVRDISGKSKIDSVVKSLKNYWKFDVETQTGEKGYTYFIFKGEK